LEEGDREGHGYKTVRRDIEEEEDDEEKTTEKKKKEKKKIVE
jgi:hypothetical protein